MGGVRPVSGELEVSSAWDPVEGPPEEAGIPVDLLIPKVESTWSAVVGWILPHHYRMTIRFLDDPAVPTLTGLRRTVNSAADLGQMEKAHLVSRMCRGPVSGRPVRTLIFPHSWLMGEDSRRGLVLVASRVREGGASVGWVGSGVLVGMARRLVWTLLLSRTVEPPRRSYPLRPVSGVGRCQRKTWRPLTMTRLGLSLSCSGSGSWVVVGRRRRCVLIPLLVVRRLEGSVVRARRSACLSRVGILV